jgi:hypothetical protein
MYSGREIGRLAMNWGGEYMQNLHLQIHPVFNPMLSRAIIWDFRLRIADCGLRICGIATLYQF